MSKNLKGPLMLLIAALIWGSSFIVMKNATDFLTPAVLLLIRFSLASVFLYILFYKKIKTYPKDKIKGGLLTGCCLFSAYYVQTWGLSFTTPGKNAFLTAVYCAIVPFLIWVVYRKKPDSYNFLAAFLCVFGIGLVSLDGDLSVNIGDMLTLGGGFLYAIHILMIKKFSEGIDGGAFTTFQFIGGTGVALLVSLLTEDLFIVKMIQPSIFFQIFYLAFFATAVTMVCQTVGQKYTSECNASLILSLESVFGVIFSVLFYGEILTKQVLLGFIIIFVAIIISETKLSFLKPKKVLSVFIIFVILLSQIFMNQSYATDNVNVDAPYAYVYNMTTNQVLYEKNAHSKIYPASMTKVMTALVALENMDDLTTVTTIQKYDLQGLWEAGASTANLAIGEKVTYLDLIHGIILPSGADACRATSRVLFGSEEKMVEQMNKKAKELGLKNTHFANSTGLHDDNHYTTVHDMGVITEAALQNKTFKKVFTTRSYRTETTNHYMAATILKLHWKTHISTSHVVGCKTGYTKESKSCLTCLVNSQKQDIICVFAKEANSAHYINDAKKVVNYYNQNYHPITLLKKGESFQTIEIKDGIEETYDITAPYDVTVFMKKGIDKEDLKVKYEGEMSLVAPTTKNDKLGNIIVQYKDKTLRTIPVSMDREIDATDMAKFVRYVKAHIEVIVGCIIIIIICLLLLCRALKIRRLSKKKAYLKYKQSQK